jgi:5-oxoprolinase (ATP-hydrolysing)
MTHAVWQFWIDVGGTFTDCVVVPPDAAPRILKVLSSGRCKGTWSIGPTSDRIDTTLTGFPPNFFRGYHCDRLDAAGQVVASQRVVASDPDGSLTLEARHAPAAMVTGSRCELHSGEGAPLVAIRQALGLRLDEPIPPVSVRLGTTRGTNALLTRRGAVTGFVTTRGFRDVLLIANQDRPKLFELVITKPTPLFAAVAEIEERLSADGGVLRAPSREQVVTELTRLRDAGCGSLAICLLHAFANPAHEEFVAEVAAELGFRHVSVSSRLSPLIKIVPRGDTTVMDAYLNPVLRDYVASLVEKLPGSDLKLMTSAGGLVTAARFSGKESVLSGPAGGVIGFARAARQAGHPRAIGFDMGGTSTDVSRFDGRYDYEWETTKAGVRIVTPMLAIETVAAGGGSVCGFDGVKLFVGPDSAGSDPGPACYGRGGPLTVTDCNVWLGRIPAERFPFALDQAAIAERLTTLRTAIAGSPLGHDYTLEALAAGFLEIANATMARAIRKVSVAKGYDPADYALVPFGGAGGQHACALARLLGMTRILVHPWAGVLSAYGIGHADVRRFGQQGVLRPYSAEVLDELSPIIIALGTQAVREVLAEGIPPERIDPPVVTLDLRYQGVEATISVPRPVDGDYPAAYARQHLQLYGYVREGRPLEIVAVRVEVTGRGAAAWTPATHVKTSTHPTPLPEEHHLWWRGERQTVPVYARAGLDPGHIVSGPAIIAESTSTLVIDPGFQAEVLSQGELLITAITTPDHATDHASSITSAVDPVQLELFHQTFTSIAEQMGLTLQQTSVSTNVKERLDFSCAIFDAQGGLVVNAPHIPVHLGAMGETVRCVLRDMPDLAPGDVIVTNDPYRGGSHLPDVTVVTPVHHSATGRLLFLTASRAHHAEIGGIVPGSMPPFSKHLGEEGVLIRNFRLIRRGVSHEDELAALLAAGPYPSRNVADNLSDVRAQVAANQIGARLLWQLVRDKGLDHVLAYMGHLQTAAAQAMRQVLRGLPDGDYRFVDHLDDGSPIAVRITIDGDTAVIDFDGTGPVLATNLNANRAIVTAAVLYSLRCLIGQSPAAAGLPLNGGVLEPITIRLPVSLLNPPEGPTTDTSPAMVGGNVETSQRVVDVLLGALGLAAASQGTMNNLTFGDGTFGYYETICGGCGATAAGPGADAVHTHMTNTRLTDAEIIERRYPVRLREFSIRRGSGGAGTHRGGDGVRRVIEFLRPIRVSLLTERRGPYPPYGMHGGHPGSLGQNTLTHPDGTTTNLGAKASFDVAAGAVLTLETPGGGGWGETL